VHYPLSGEYIQDGFAIAHAISRQLPMRQPGFDARKGNVFDEVALELAFSECFGFPANSHSTNSSISSTLHGLDNKSAVREH
jgi:hypothetical protein